MFSKIVKSTFSKQMSYLFLICVLSSTLISFMSLLEICSPLIPLKLVHLFLWIMLLIMKVMKFLSSFRYFSSFSHISSPNTISFSYIFSGKIDIKSIWNRSKRFFVTLQDRILWCCSAWCFLHKLQMALVCNWFLKAINGVKKLRPGVQLAKYIWFYFLPSFISMDCFPNFWPICFCFKNVSPLLFKMLVMCKSWTPI